jgi:hypothetical protein
VAVDRTCCLVAGEQGGEPAARAVPPDPHGVGEQPRTAAICPVVSLSQAASASSSRSAAGKLRNAAVIVASSPEYSRAR